MSVLEILRLAAQATPSAQSPSTGEPVEAGLFASLLQGQDGPAPRGRLAVGRWLQNQMDPVDRLPDSTDPSVPTVLIYPGTDQPLINPGPNAEAKPDQPLINPGPNREAKPVAPLINPGPNAEVKPAQPLINPGPSPTTKPDVALVLPGAADGAAAATGAPDSSAMSPALQALAGDGQTRSASALVQAAQQAVARAPELEPRAERPQAALAETTPRVGAPAADLTATATGVAQAAPSPGPSAAASTDPLAAAPSPADQAAADPTSSAPDPAVLDSSASDALQTDAEVPSAPLPSSTSQVNTRADGVALAGRLSFDTLAQVSAQIIRRLETRVSRFDMELNPAELGRVDVRLDIDGDGRLAARLAFDNPAAALELRGRVDELRRDLQQAGFQLADDAFSFAEREGSQSRQSFDEDAARRTHARSAEAADLVDAAAQPALRTMTRLGLDVRV